MTTKTKKTNDPLKQSAGEHSYGEGLVLRVTANEQSRRWMTYAYIAQPAPAKSQRIAYMIDSALTMSLADAAKQVKWAHGHANAGRDPRVEREKLLADELVKRNRNSGPTFLEYAHEKHAKWKAEWKPEQAKKWIASIVNHCGHLHHMQLSAIRVADVIATLEPIWQTYNIAAQDVRGRIERLLSAAVGTYRDEGVPNPAAWTEVMKDALGKPMIRGAEHHPTMDYQAVPAFLVKLQARTHMAARMIETVILTALRSQEVRFIRKSWLDLDAGVMTVPKEVFKVQHGFDLPVPLCPRLIEIFRERIEALDRIIGTDEDYYIWAGQWLTEPVNHNFMRSFMKDEMGIDADDACVHGFRASFSTWADDKLLATTPPLANEMAVELCMAHMSGNKTRGGVKRVLRSKSTLAYKSKTMFEARVPIMQMWSDYCLPPAKGNVVKLRTAA